MPESKLEGIVFGAIMAIVMVYGMIVYNVAIEFGGMSNEIFVIALHELIIMAPIAFILEGLFVEKLAVKLAFRIVKPTDRKVFIIIAIQTMIVLIMCPIMSFIATLLFADAGNQIISVWLQKYTFNLPFALMYQIIICGPLVRRVVKLLPLQSKQGNEQLVNA